MHGLAVDESRIKKIKYGFLLSMMFFMSAERETHNFKSFKGQLEV